MSQRRSIFATAIAVTAITIASGGFGGTGSVSAQGNNEVRRSTTTNVPSTIKVPMGGPRTKNAALPTATTKPKAATTKPKPKPSQKKKAAATTIAPAGK